MFNVNPCAPSGYVSVILFFLYFCPQSRGQSDNLWQGKITYRHVHSASSPTSKYKLELIMEAIIVNGKATVTGSERNFLRNMCESSDYYAEGTRSDFHDFHLSFDSEMNAYSTEIYMPVMKGIKNIDYIGECQVFADKSEPVGIGDLMIMIEGMKVGNDPDILIGDSTWGNEEKSGSETFVNEFIVSWSLTRGPVDVELIITPEEYEEWLPVPGKSEKDAGSHLLVLLQLKSKTGGKPKLKASSFVLELKNTSKEPGIAVNAPLPSNGEPLFDLAFASSDGQHPTDNGQKLRLESHDGISAVAVINSFDGGAYTTLVASAILQNGKEIQGMLLNSRGTSDVLLPKRSGSSSIATAWLKNNGNPGDRDDNDKSKGNTNNGDGLTAYEEYRGVISQGQHKRLSPQKKEIGVQVSKNEEVIFKEGIDLLQTASGINMITFNEEELPDDRSLNFNSKTGKMFAQHALRLVREDKGEGVAGYNDPVEVLSKRPGQSKRVVINIEHHAINYSKQRDSLKKANITMPYTMKENLAMTVAHELGHGINLGHHGEPSQEPERYIPKNTPTPFQVFNYFGKEDECPCEITGLVGTKQNEESGDLSCVMAYVNYYAWVHYRDSDGSLVYRQVPTLPVGKKLCSSNTGTGINAGGNFFADAPDGNCLSRIIVRDE